MKDLEERIYGISYLFSDTPAVKAVSESGVITYNPLLVYAEEKEERGNNIQAHQGFSLSYKQMKERVSTDYQKKRLYEEMRKHSRESQEKIIAEYICSVIMRELRDYKEQNLTFIISDKFQSEKIIGRLGYLGLPLERVHIFFVSRNISSFMTDYIEPIAIPPQNDLKLLFMKKNRGEVLGPYPDDDVVSMIRTFFCSFQQDELYPIRVNLFSQSLEQKDLNEEKERIRQIFMREEETELFDVSGGTGREKTRLPKALVKCEEIVKNERKKIRQG
ncbi:MAG: hypothetical protein HDQ96_00110 [Lachnospiraceae bacterium]|nr:hypothetical protein [Lachnospiraceae bacterium]